MYTTSVTKKKNYRKTHAVDGMSYIDIKLKKPSVSKGTSAK